MTMNRVRRTRPVPVPLPARVVRTRPAKPKGEVLNLDEISGGRLVSMYLMASFLYYHENVSIIEDGEYDALCKKLLKELPTIKHNHRHLVSRESLKAGTAYHLRRDDYPLIVMSAAEHWYKQLKGKSWQ